MEVNSLLCIIQAKITVAVTSYYCIQGNVGSEVRNGPDYHLFMTIQLLSFTPIYLHSLQICL